MREKAIKARRAYQVDTVALCIQGVVQPLVVVVIGQRLGVGPRTGKNVALLAFVVSRSAPEMTDGNQRPVAAW